ncbi:phosphodiesterase [Pseudodonghicola xiamenensis]|uniref:3',5'-cyclic adenosine monophosphate phosphodiesterase CpdA n=1 Tax=Pseudodonghicola xiamenensis TaxID=337702 RepID=A0A8J3HDR3_9RHOB|nr:phosphodiesterase [Pseudodonghicola xiamenensis]GHH05503.1 3',5'-cyclic adenosine monophosphate phosphodiesterase CpdA [Pseudodonghicola xiamenensis]
MTTPLRFAVLTDLHFVPAGQTIYGFDPRESLRRALAFLDTLPQVDFLLICGDLTDRAELAAYESLRDELAALRLPVILMLGNHDARAPFRATFPEADDVGGFVQGLHVFEQASLITLDTLAEGEPGHHGRLCDRRLAFLETALSEAPTDRPVLLFQHHPPMELSIPPMDAIRLCDAAAELAVFECAGRKPDYLFMGHVHRPIIGLWQGIPYHIQRALMHQVHHEFDQPGRIMGAIEAPDLAYVTVKDGDVLIHDCSFAYDGPVFDLESPEAAAVAHPQDLERY